MERWKEEEELPPVGRPYGIDPNRLYTMEFAASLLSVERKLVRWWIKKGVIEGIRLPNRAWRIRGIEIIRIIDQGRTALRPRPMPRPGPGEAHTPSRADGGESESGCGGGSESEGKNPAGSAASMEANFK